MSLVHGARGTAEVDAAHLIQGQKHLAPEERIYTLTVPVRTLTAVLDSHKVSCLDLLSLDVEGFEAAVLRGLDFRRYQPTYILLEANDPEETHALL